MMWYFFVLTAVAGGAVTAGFCMGRITGRKGEKEEEVEEEAWEAASNAVETGRRTGNAGAASNRETWESGKTRGRRVPEGESMPRGRRTPEGKSMPGGRKASEGASMPGGRRTAGNGRSQRAGRAPEDRRPAREHRMERPGNCGYVGSPVSGQVCELEEGESPAVVINPREDRLYAPANGKITRLFPMGNAFLFHTEFGAELLIQAGDARDDLLGRYFRPRVLQNEIVGKGKLLLEFDRQGLESEGVSPEVRISVETGVCGSSVLPEAGEQVRTGEEIFLVEERPLWELHEQ